MANMFTSASSFNQDLSNWEVLPSTLSLVTTMSGMFQNASSFNHSLGGWSLNSNVIMSNMLNNSGLSVTNYDNTLIGWNSNPTTPVNRSVGVSGLKYCNGEAARTNLDGPKGWTFTGDSKDCTGLPVELIDFKAIAQDNRTALLTWRSASELNNEGFEVERSMDGAKWEMLDFVPGNGTTQAEQSYSFTDERPIPGTNYYRLRQVDFDGKFEYSVVRSVSMKGGANGVQVYPNPVQGGMLNVNFTEELEDTATLRIFDASGRLLRQEVLPSQHNQTNYGNLSAGVYFIELSNRQGREVMKVVR